MPKYVKCIKKVTMDNFPVFAVDEQYEMLNEYPSLEVIDDTGVNHRIGKNFKDKWFVEHFREIR
jgi:hypothetical protein